MSEMSDTDIVSELRKLHAEILASDEGRECEMMALVRTSADEIERLRRQRDELLEALGDLHDAIMEIATKTDAVIARAEGRSDE